MKKVTMQLPVGNTLTGEMTGRESFTGFIVAGMFVHPSDCDRMRAPNKRWLGPWTVTHAPTGYSIKKGLRNKGVAISLAQRLATLNCWDFETADGAKSIPQEAMRDIRWYCAEAA